MAETVQKNFRMSAEAIKLLHEVARARGTTETEVVQYCVSKYALEMGWDVDRAKELLFRQICEAAAKSPGGTLLRSEAPARQGTPGQRVAAPRESSASNEESRREGRKGVRAEAGTAESAAGTLASVAGEGWGEGKKERGKKKSG